MHEDGLKYFIVLKFTTLKRCSMGEERNTSKYDPVCIAQQIQK